MVAGGREARGATTAHDTATNPSFNASACQYCSTILTSSEQDLSGGAHVVGAMYGIVAFCILVSSS